MDKDEQSGDFEISQEWLIKREKELKKELIPEVVEDASSQS